MTDETLTRAALTHTSPPVALGGGKYRVVRTLGRGAMGVVYEAEQEALRRRVAVKLLHSSVTQKPQARERFRREALAASRIEHRNSTRIFDFGEEADGTCYIVMELLQGRSLGDISVDAGPMALGRAVDYLAQALSALAVAHDAGIVHRDLKPDNIVIVDGIDDHGAPVEVAKVCDFGIAKLAGGESGETLTQDGTVSGTPHYMSPEQCQGKALDARSDLYACGVILYRLLAGEVPFTGDNAFAVVFRQVTETHRPIRDVRPELPPAVDAFLSRAMAKEPDQRYANAREMRAALRALLDGAASAELVRPGAVLVQPVHGPGAVSEPTIDIEPDAFGAAAATTNSTPALPAAASPWTARVAVLLAAVAAVAAVAALLRSPTPEPPAATTTRIGAVETEGVAGSAAAAVPPRDEAASAGVVAARPAEAADVAAPAPPQPDAPIDPVLPDDPAGATAAALAAAADAGAAQAPPLPPEPAAAAPAEPRPSRAPPRVVRAAPAPPVEPAAAPKRPTPPSDAPPVEVPVDHGPMPRPNPPTPPPTDAVPVPPAGAQSAGTDVPEGVKPVPLPPPRPLAPIFNPDPTIVLADVTLLGGLSKVAVQQALAGIPKSARACWLQHAKPANFTERARVELDFEIDEDGRFRKVTGGGGPKGLATCVAGKVALLRSRNRPDTGTVRGAASVEFRP